MDIKEFSKLMQKHNEKDKRWSIIDLITFVLIGIVNIDNYNYISKYGENMYDLVEGGNIIASEARVEQGVLEQSNVNIVSEMVEMITITRSYEANQKVIQTIDTTLDKAVNSVGKV